ncbi:unnamed protein product [[Candida] boidinii]|uniref:Unnamed protein product n=1 Tax=Candida boidinii TaxID=5477 RepID=A0A9W6T894_CANBO|nr:unnamed protein product [[Candida] boidinii]GME78812.1 unnamed protein product [[Candida] boidinii]
MCHIIVTYSTSEFAVYTVVSSLEVVSKGSSFVPFRIESVSSDAILSNFASETPIPSQVVASVSPETSVSLQVVVSVVDTATYTKTETETISYSNIKSLTGASEAPLSISKAPNWESSEMQSAEEEIVTFTIALTIQQTETLISTEKEKTMTTSAKSSSASLSSGAGESTGILTDYTDGSLGRQVNGIFKAFSVIVCVMLFV